MGNRSAHTRPINGPLCPESLKLADIALLHMDQQRQHGMLYDLVGHALCTTRSVKPESGPFSGHWYRLADTAHEENGRGAIIPFRFKGVEIEVHLPAPHAKKANCWLYSNSEDGALNDQAAFAFATVFIAKFWELHRDGIMQGKAV